MRRAFVILSRAAWVIAGIYLILVAIKALGAGAGFMRPIVTRAHVEGVTAWVGLGWIGAAAFMSGSPAAALALSFLEQGLGDRFETFGMIMGSRLGASFVVLLVGFLHDWKAKTPGKSVYVGVASLLTSTTICVPGLFIGLHLLSDPAWLERFTPDLSNAFGSVVEPLLRPAVFLLKKLDNAFLAFAAGIALLLGAFHAFDKALPDMSDASKRFSTPTSTLYRPSVMFAIGFVITLITMSVSMSLTILVPLTAKGYVRRENLFPYIMGANISTFIDTLFVSLLVRAPEAPAVVLAVIVSIASVAVPIVVLCCRPYERLLDRVARAAIRTGFRRALVVSFTLVVPLVLLFL